MSNSLYVSLDKFPFCDLPNTPEQYFEQVRYRVWRRNEGVLRSRETLIAALESDEYFAAFWKGYRETHPDSVNYLSSLTDHSQPFRNFKIANDYDRWLRCQNLSDIPTAAREMIQSEFVAIRPTLYQGFLEKEALRLNCAVSEVRPMVPVLPLEENGGESEMCCLPDDVLTKIMAHLETIEIFHLTQVCMRWRQIVYRNAAVVTRAEHSLTTHLLTFADWMDPSIVVKGKHFIKHYRSFGWGLMKWCCNISRNLETLVLLEINRPYDEVMHLLGQCPNLKHLHLSFRDEGERAKTDFCLPRLETLITEDSHGMPTSELVLNALTTSNNLRVLKGKLYAYHIITIEDKRLNQNAFSNLIALQLSTFSFDLLEELASLDQLQLRYLHLGSHWDFWRIGMDADPVITDKERDALHGLLSKQNQLEVLVSVCDLIMDENTIKLVTKQNQKLKSAVIRFHVRSLENGGGLDSLVRRDRSDGHAALLSFEEMLLEKDPSIDLSSFVFLARDERSKSFLEDATTGFSIYLLSEKQDEVLDKWSLSHPAMRRQLGVEF